MANGAMDMSRASVSGLGTDLIAAVGNVFLAISRSVAILATHHSMINEINRLNRMTDEDFGKLNIRRDQTIHYVARKYRLID